jgi:hypothetical protein
MFPIVGGYWTNAASAGVFYRNFNIFRSYDYFNAAPRASDYFFNLTSVTGILER